MSGSASGRWSPFAAPVLLALWIVGLLLLLFVQVRHPEPFLNDSVLHFGLVQALASAPGRGQSLLDPWVSSWAMGFPVFHYYQNLPHLLVLALWKLSLGGLSLLQAFRVIEWLAVATLPFPVYVSARWLGFGRFAAAMAGGLVLLTKTNYLHGLDLESYTWQGLGQFAQAVGGWVFPLAFAKMARAAAKGEGLAVTAWLMCAAFLTHLALGYMAFLCAGLLVLLSPREIPRRVLRVAVPAAVAVAGAAYMIVPILRDFAYYNVSDLVPTWKYTSFGHRTVLHWLFTGELFDYGRAPLLTVLVGVGVVWAATRTVLHFRGRLEQPEAERVLLASFVLFLLLFFGRPTWKGLLDLLPLGSGFHWSRAIYPVHLFGTMLAGIALADVLGRLGRRGALAALAAVAIGAALIVPPTLERVSYLRHNADLVREAAEGLAAERDDLDAALSLAAEDRLGRVYAGQGRAGSDAWGGAFQVGWVPVYSWFPLRGMDALGYLHHMWSLNADLQSAFNERNPDHYRIFNVRRVIAPVGLRTPSFYRELDRFGRFRVLAVDGPGFVELVDAPYRVDAPKENIYRVHRRWLAELAPGGIHPELRIVKDGAAKAPDAPLLDGYQIDFPPAAIPPGPRGEILEVRRSGDDFFVRARADRACHLLLKMSFHPGWRATVDGRPASTAHLLPSYLGVPLSPGEHEVEFRWEPGDLKEVLAIAGFLVLSLFSLAARRFVI